MWFNTPELKWAKNSPCSIAHSPLGQSNGPFRSCKFPCGGYNHHTGPVWRNTGLPKPCGQEYQQHFPQTPAEGDRDVPAPAHPVYFYHSRGERKKKHNPPHLAINELIRKLCALSADRLQGEAHQTHLDLKRCAPLGSRLISPADRAGKPGRSADNGLAPHPLL